MAATDTFNGFTASLSENDRRQVQELLGVYRTQLLAARSEEARVRIAHEGIREIHDRLRPPRKG